ncbi:MAG TPA: hypothetical protein VGS23_03530 [Thermoplasmata archaeon]|nr:hypothetical protein [Thermoplasmata archaeon]
MHDDRATGRAGSPRSAFQRATDWLAVAIVGAVLLAAGIYRPATSWIHGPTAYGTPWVAVGVALLGGILLGLGLSKWYDLRPEGPAARRRPPTRVDMSRASNLSSFEVYGGAPKGRRRNKSPKV